MDWWEAGAIFEPECDTKAASLNCSVLYIYIQVLHFETYFYPKNKFS
jgi:hypothetical protein